MIARYESVPFTCPSMACVLLIKSINRFTQPPTSGQSLMNNRRCGCVNECVECTRGLWTDASDAGVNLHMTHTTHAPPSSQRHTN
jgi:hypothetical protein